MFQFETTLDIFNTAPKELKHIPILFNPLEAGIS